MSWIFAFLKLSQRNRKCEERIKIHFVGKTYAIVNVVNAIKANSLLFFIVSTENYATKTRAKKRRLSSVNEAKMLCYFYENSNWSHRMCAWVTHFRQCRTKMNRKKSIFMENEHRIASFGYTFSHIVNAGIISKMIHKKTRSAHVRARVKIKIVSLLLLFYAFLSSYSLEPSKP